ncbi:MAG TPA: hypothetical protein VMZ28_29630 [Kofleriaceae bacterium]|nr:hypothetical protein [Kofleriaceae bacterium]
MGRKGKLRATTEPDQAVVWRSGVHVAGTAIWCDARRARDLCFVSRADRVSASRHGQLIATAETLALLARAVRGAGGDSELSVPPGRPFSLGTIRLELFRAGSAIGAASLWVDLGERRVVYAGAVNPAGGGLGGAADHRACDVLVLHAGYGDPRVSFPPVDRAVDETAALVAGAVAAGGAAILLVAGALEGLDVAHRLLGAGLPPACDVVAHRSIHHAAQRLRTAGRLTLEVRRAGRAVRAGQVLLWPASRRSELERMARPDATRIALVSAGASEPDAVARARAEHGIVWASEADHAGLLRYVDESGARSIYLTGRFAEPMAAELTARGLSARPLGPPVQMSLFT